MRVLLLRGARLPRRPRRVEVESAPAAAIPPQAQLRGRRARTPTLRDGRRRHHHLRVHRHDDLLLGHAEKRVEQVRRLGAAILGQSRARPRARPLAPACPAAACTPWTWTSPPLVPVTTPAANRRRCMTSGLILSCGTTCSSSVMPSRAWAPEGSASQGSSLL